ncbi:hypothetical protein PRIPAC_71245 [Pristionchus pacificus]|uniref:Transcription factor CBF/NF-Y/archaeal histone domain-containing protein n=1 Tax=Pristionchus pacificus TaxID=54126 RepID=A0A8R1V2C6_PRIPA|nr:hypothetical protein PRIPAC_71245 [Pristionchus pacificus]
MAGSESSFSHFESEANEGSYSSPLHSPSHRHSESDGSPASSMAYSSLTGGVALQKVRQIASTQGEVLPFTPDGIYALAKVAELFVDHLLRETMELHDENIDYDELADTIQNDEDLSFLHDFFPTRISFEEAQAKMAEKIHDDDD